MTAFIRMIKRNTGIVFLVFVLLAATLPLVSCGGDGGSNPVLFTATVTGSVQYEDREYGPAGFTGTTPYFKPSRFVLVEIVDTATGLVLAKGTTGTTGAYRIPFFFSFSSVYVRIVSEAILSGAHTIEVRSLSNKLYAVASGTFSVSPGAVITRDVSISLSAGLPAGVFNILDVYASGFEFVKALSGTYPPALTAYWQPGNSNGTYYLSGSGIYLLGGDGIGGGDTDEYDDDVLWHEFGHFIADKFSKDDSPGGVHHLTDNNLDLRLSWSEGWGDFSQGAVKYWLSANDPTRLSTEAGTSSSTYVDTSNVSWSFEFNTLSGDPYTTAANEVAVAKTLWNLMTGTGNFGMTPVWDVFQNYLPTVSGTPVNIEAFWDGWLAQRSPQAAETALIEGIYSDRKINYRADAFEPDDGFVRILPSIALNYAEEHYLYNSAGPDKDIIPFTAVSGVSYMAQTSQLLNGADTYIRVRAPDQTTVVGSNDNTTLLASSVQFTAASNGTYYIEVTSSGSRPLSAGRYGTYTLRIVQQ